MKENFRNIANLTLGQRMVLEKKLKRHLHAAEIRTIPRRNMQKHLSLSFAQQRLWFLSQLEPHSSFYNVPCAIQLTGKLDRDALERSLGEIMMRHEILRTTFPGSHGQPFQRIASTCSFSLPITDLSDLPPAEQEVQVRLLANEEAQKPFDLAAGPLIRVNLLRIGEPEHVLLFTMHHIISDGWSLGIWARELAALYSSFAGFNSEPALLPELPVQYADFALWQRERLQGERLEELLTYWKTQLKNAPTLLQMPTDRVRPAIQTFQGACASVKIPKRIHEGLQDLGQREGVTLYMVLLSAFLVLLARYAQQRDIVVGSPIAGRTYKELEGLIGFFVNTLALRVDLSDNPSFRELLGQVREVTLGAFSNQDLPFDMLVEALQVERSLNHNPLFQVMFQLRNAPSSPMKLPGLALNLLEIAKETTQFDLTLSITEEEEGLSALWEYSTDLFYYSTIERMMRYFSRILASVVDKPELCLEEISLLSEEERKHILVDCNNTSYEYPQEQCLHELFEEQVIRTPNAIAVVCGEEHLTYSELNSRANQLARYLRSRGVGPDVLVGICVERSMEIAVGFLGILKAGGAYVPIDPAYPKERISFILEDSSVRILVTQQQLLSILPSEAGAGRFVVYLDVDWKDICQLGKENLPNKATGKNLAYVIYTSGSTGRPKGVLISHRSVMNFSLAIIQQCALGANDRILQTTSISFDTSVEEFFPAWISGATVVIGPAYLLSSPVDFMQFQRKEKLTVLDLPTAFWHEWVSYLQNAAEILPPTLRLVIVGGEKAQQEKFLIWQKLVSPTVRWIDEYGPTEATIVATWYEPNVHQHDSGFGLAFSIGRPIRNVQTYVLDKQFQVVPIGVVGELYIGGYGLARGYLNRPDLTAERFIPNPFSDKQGTRLYKTGDMARYLTDGTIEFIGRSDRQIKIRGYRVELGEIETALRQFPGLQDVAVVVQRDRTNSPRLVTYVVSTESEVPPSSELRRFLQERLPDYMVPVAFVSLDAFPLTSNGKLDYAAFPVFEQILLEPESDFVEPRTPVEQTLARIWADVLKLERVGIHDNFFDLGGDSLISLQIIAESHSARLHITPKQLFQYQTIAELAAEVTFLA